MDYAYLALDFWRYLRGKDYFRQPQGLGPYFRDARCYYNDLTSKALWDGEVQDGVPVLFLPSSGKTVASPCMVLLWALGSLDRYFLEGKGGYLDNAERAARWLVANVLPAGYWEGDFQASDPSHEYYSGNSCMNQGLALSFLTRVLQNRLFDSVLRVEIEDIARRVAENMLRPLDQGGTARERGEDLYLFEFASKDECVVFNGWVYGLFGLWDHARRTADPVTQRQLDRSLATFKRALPRSVRNDGWSYYDTGGRLASPFYHDLHISLLEALHLLTGERAFREQMRAFQNANGRLNRVWFTLNKIKDKLRDNALYSSQA
jgi:heparosan-N-sulfate-glucuronate 5-epimerase